jgi:hypothetical protein
VTETKPAARAPGKVRIMEGRHDGKRTIQPTQEEEREKEKVKPAVTRRKRIIPE